MENSSPHGESEKLLLRIFLDKFQHWHHQSAYVQIVDRARKNGLAGATVLEGVEGFSQNGRMFQDSVWVPTNEEVIVEIIDDSEKVRAFLEEIEPMLEDAVVTFEPARVVRYMATARKQTS